MVLDGGNKNGLVSRDVVTSIQAIPCRCGLEITNGKSFGGAGIVNAGSLTVTAGNIHHNHAHKNVSAAYRRQSVRMPLTYT